MNKFQRSDPKLDGQQSWGQFMQQFCWIQTDLCLWMALADNYILWTAVVDSLVLLLAVETSDCLCELQLLTAWCRYMQWKPVTISVNCSYWQLGAVTCSGNQWLSLWTAVTDSLVLLLAVETSDYLCELQLLTAWCCYWQWKPVTVSELQLMTAWCCYRQWKPVTVSVNCSCWQLGAITGSGNHWLSLWTAVVDI